jgi:hypothetical protein
MSLDSPICGIDRDGLARATKRAPANNRAVMLIGDGRETNPASEFYAWAESIDDVVGKLVCTGFRVMERRQTYNRTPVILANAHCAKARGSFGRLVIADLPPNAREPLVKAWTNDSKK